jgi:hypothetical protein
VIEGNRKQFWYKIQKLFLTKINHNFYLFIYLFSDSATFVAVPAPGTYYSIRVSPSTNEIAPKIYVDGLNDGSYVKKSDSSYGVKKGFKNKNRTKRYDFIFDNTEWVETNITQRSKFGGLGAISVYFYKIKKRYNSSRSSSSCRDFEEVKIPETKKYFDMALTTKFSEGIEIHKSRHSLVLETDKEPLAVLHINYRLADWLIPMAATQNSCTSASTSTSSTSTLATSSTPTSAVTMDIKNEVTNFKSDIESKPLITQSARKRKRKYQEIIIILDSDEERAHEAAELDK